MKIPPGICVEGVTQIHFSCIIQWSFSAGHFDRTTVC